MGKEFDFAVFIGRFQPFHNEHLRVLRQGLDIAERILLLVGSYRVASNTKNPFTFEDRSEMICRCLSADEQRRVVMLPIRDHYYSDSMWVAEVQQKTSYYIHPGTRVALVGAFKDASSYYLKYFPHWTFVGTKQEAFLDSTAIRHKFFYRDEPMMDFNFYHSDKARASLKDESWKKNLPEGVQHWLEEKYFQTSSYHEHVQEYNFLEEYKKKWGPGPFVTADALVTCSGHLLVIERKNLPGRFQLALPGGFLKLSETVAQAALRELYEETGLGPFNEKMIVDNKVFDYPNRSLRGRIITHAFHIPLIDAGILPRFHAGDDAKSCQWMQFNDVILNENHFFEDHAHIINYFLSRR